MHSVDMAECNYKINPPEVSKRIHILISQTWIRTANDFVMVRRHQDSSSRYDPFFPRSRSVPRITYANLPHRTSHANNIQEINK